MAVVRIDVTLTGEHVDVVCAPGVEPIEGSVAVPVALAANKRDAGGVEIFGPKLPANAAIAPSSRSREGGATINTRSLLVSPRCLRCDHSTPPSECVTTTRSPSPSIANSSVATLIHSAGTG